MRKIYREKDKKMSGIYKANFVATIIIGEIMLLAGIFGLYGVIAFVLTLFGIQIYAFMNTTMGHLVQFIVGICVGLISFKMGITLRNNYK
jgi:hypothetical protein